MCRSHGYPWIRSRRFEVLPFVFPSQLPGYLPHPKSKKNSKCIYETSVLFSRTPSYADTGTLNDNEEVKSEPCRTQGGWERLRKAELTDWLQMYLIRKLDMSICASTSRFAFHWFATGAISISVNLRILVAGKGRIVFFFLCLGTVEHIILSSTLWG